VAHSAGVNDGCGILLHHGHAERLLAQRWLADAAAMLHEAAADACSRQARGGFGCRW
jgi:glycerol-3-phosphate cytidylyltransferase-like family protein